MEGLDWLLGRQANRNMSIHTTDRSETSCSYWDRVEFSSCWSQCTHREVNDRVIEVISIVVLGGYQNRKALVWCTQQVFELSFCVMSLACPDTPALSIQIHTFFRVVHILLTGICIFVCVCVVCRCQKDGAIYPLSQVERLLA